MEVKRYAAAGGIVTRGEEVLLLYKPRAGETVLPKGHVEAGETLEQAALREVREETGYRNLQVLADLGTERAEFENNGRWVVRDETYFLMQLIDGERMPESAHDDAHHDAQAFERRWVKLEGAAEAMSFEPARTFVRRAAAWMRARR